MCVQRVGGGSQKRDKVRDSDRRGRQKIEDTLACSSVSVGTVLPGTSPPCFSSSRSREQQGNRLDTPQRIAGGRRAERMLAIAEVGGAMVGRRQRGK